MEEEQKVTFKSCRGSGSLPIPIPKMKLNKANPSSHNNAYYVPLSDTHQCRQWHYSPSSSSSSSPTTSDHPHWSMSALMAALPESASYSLPRNQVFSILFFLSFSNLIFMYALICSHCEIRKRMLVNSALIP